LLGVLLPPAPFYEEQVAFQLFLGSYARIIVASLAAYLAGSFLNAFVMSRFKLLTRGKGFSLRAIFSTLIGEGADSLIFITVAFAGIFPLKVILAMIITQALLKVSYEIIVLPVTVLVVKKVKAIEGETIFDDSVSYNPFLIKQI
ncbi:MAG: queuosine precursor transporter, partial [Mangrovibacterium sp.]